MDKQLKSAMTDFEASNLRSLRLYCIKGQSR
jgi:hypothetical protein